MAPRISNCGYVRTMVPLNHEMGQDFVVLLITKLFFSDALRIVICLLDRTRLYHQIVNCSKVETKWAFFVAQNFSVATINPRGMNNIFRYGIIFIFIVHGRRSAWAEKKAFWGMCSMGFFESSQSFFFSKTNHN